MRRLRAIKFRLLATAIAIGLCILAAMIYCDLTISRAAEGKVFDDLAALPRFQTGLLLGTSRSLGSGQSNPYYFHRIEAAASLMLGGKIERLIVSGDNGTKGYNEPEMMRADLIHAGVDSAKIFLDYAGFRTLDSVVRCREIFSQDSILVISQKFHNERAIFIADSRGITAVGFNAVDIKGIRSTRVKVREKLARVKVVLDMLFGVQPKFSGEKIDL
jgi:SanA protein